MNKVVVPLHVAFRNCRRSSYRGSTVPESTRQKEISIRYNTLENFDRRFYPINDTSLNVTRKGRFYLQSRIEKLNIHVERRRKLFLLSVSQNHFRSPFQLVKRELLYRVSSESSCTLPRHLPSRTNLPDSNKTLKTVDHAIAATTKHFPIQLNSSILNPTPTLDVALITRELYFDRKTRQEIVSLDRRWHVTVVSSIDLRLISRRCIFICIVQLRR